MTNTDNSTESRKTRGGITSKARTTLSGGARESGKNTHPAEADDPTPAPDRGSSHLENEPPGTDAATFDPIHSEENKNKTVGTPSMYGYVDVAGVPFHPP